MSANHLISLDDYAGLFWDNKSSGWKTSVKPFSFAPIVFNEISSGNTVLEPLEVGTLNYPVKVEPDAAIICSIKGFINVTGPSASDPFPGDFLVFRSYDIEEWDGLAWNVIKHVVLPRVSPVSWNAVRDSAGTLTTMVYDSVLVCTVDQSDPYSTATPIIRLNSMTMRNQYTEDIHCSLCISLALF